MNYLKAVLKKDHKTKIVELKKIISLGKKLNKDTTPDKKKLEILLGRAKKTPTKKNITKIKNKSINYSIKSIYTKNNQIIIEFNKNISKNNIKFFELKNSKTIKDVYDFNGYYKNAVNTKLSINGVKKIVVGQYKPNILRVVLSDKKNIKTSIKTSSNKAIITVDGLKIEKKTTKPKKVKKTITKKKIVKNNKYIDTKNNIRSITSNENKIYVQFNKKPSLKNIKYLAYKYNKNYENIFEIKGKFKYTKPTSLKIENIDRVIVSDRGKKSVKIKIRDKEKNKIRYNLSNKTLTITIYQTTNTKKQAKEPKKFLFRNKIVVVDAGHGKHDAGAVGPNKRYEKVVTLKVAKYLYSILKRKGYKVYLTRYKDKFIKVVHRTKLANRKKADIFISIHANSVPKSKANKVQGIETFFLSPSRSARAKRVAARENRSDITRMSSSTKNAFLESLNRPRITASHKLAIDVQAGLLQSARSKYKDIKDSGVREGPFWVLVGAQMPSILIELGYMSHPIESKRLYTSSYQKLLAQGIAKGIDSYFIKNP